MSCPTYLDVQSNVPDLQRGSLAHVDAHKVGRVLVEDVDVSQPVQQELLADGARHRREESHGGCWAVEAPVHALQAGRAPTAVSGVSPYVVEDLAGCCVLPWFGRYRDATGPCLAIGVWAQAVMRGPG